ncbi:MAG: hypothetical protein LBU57_09200 [Dysgonamonadaceae bacterium]|jgi:hypothetical protein|nr:hypothetical protein [Dysgonamonadaceae bacterium]
MVFLLQAELTTDNKGIIEKNRYETSFRVELLKETDKDATIYDKESKMHFADPYALKRVYEVELYKIILHLSSRLEKAEDFMRRLMYRYDWIHPTVNLKGEVVSIENKAELKESWQEIKTRITKDYKGEVVDEYLEKTGMEFASNDPVYPVFHQYFLFGLLFPAIPEKHGPAWERKRFIELSPYEQERFEEHITYAGTIDNNREYNIKGTVLPESDSELEKFEGYSIVPVNQFFPLKTVINTAVKRESIESQWSFNLERYT